MKLSNEGPQDGDEEFLAYESTPESVRFSRVVRRYILIGHEYESMVRRIEQDAPDLAIVRFSTGREELLTRLRSICSDVVVGDRLNHLSRNNREAGPPPPPRNADLVIQEATQADLGLLDSLTAKTFESYRNHYTANPTLKGFDLAEGYKEWIRAHVEKPGKGCLLGFFGKELVTFLTRATDSGESRFMLGGVSPSHRNRGVFRDIITSSVALFMEEGFPVTTADVLRENAAVHKAFSSVGFLPVDSYYTVHLNLWGQLGQKIPAASLPD